MSTRTTGRIRATPEQVWDVLADGWLFPLWVVGASRMRAVDPTWPEVGSLLHHSVGAWPVLIDDETEVLDARPPSFLSLQAKAWPTGEARVDLHLAASGSTTVLTLEEDAHLGPARVVPPFLRQPPLRWRNEETVRRLTLLVEGRTGMPR